MSKRNLVLFIIILIIVLVAIFGFWYFNQSSNQTGNTNGTNFLSHFSPFGGGKNNPTPTTTPNNTTNYQPNPTATIVVKLKKVSSMPIAGYTVFSKERFVVIPTPPTETTNTTTPSSTSSGSTIPTATTTQTKTIKTKAPLTEFAPALRYVARATGNIFETFADTIKETQFSSTLIPEVYDAYFSNKGQSVAMRYLESNGRTIDTYFSNLPKEIFGSGTSIVNDIKGTLLTNDIKDISVSSDGGSMFYLFNNGTDMIGTTMNTVTGKKVQIFDSPFTEWLSNWSSNKVITLTTKPSYGTPGYMYILDPTNPANTKIYSHVLGGINGLTTLTSPNGNLVLYSDNNLSLGIYNISTNSHNQIGINTLPEKCVWNNSSTSIYCAVPKSITTGEYPDSWYQGEVSFSDDFWKIDAKTGETTLLVDPATVTGGEDIDGIKLSLDPSENYLFFVNKKDSYLWEFNLK